MPLMRSCGHPCPTRLRSLLGKAPFLNFRDSTAPVTCCGVSTTANATFTPAEPRRIGVLHTPPSIYSTTLNCGTIGSLTTTARTHGSNLCCSSPPDSSHGSPANHSAHRHWAMTRWLRRARTAVYKQPSPSR
jgi:hypothetical protein